MAPYGYLLTTAQQVDQAIPRMGFIASASDLVPLAVGLEAGSVIVAPVSGDVFLPDGQVQKMTEIELP